MTFLKVKRQNVPLKEDFKELLTSCFDNSEVFCFKSVLFLSEGNIPLEPWAKKSIKRKKRKKTF